MEKDNEERLKNEMVKYIEGSKQDREVEKQERIDVAKFLEREDIKKLFETYDKSLNLMFRFYANQDTQKDRFSFDADFLANSLSYKEVVRFCY